MTAHDLVQIEERNYFFDWNFFPIVLRGPAKQAEIVADRLRQKAPLNIIVYARALVALAHFRAVPVKDKWDVREVRRAGPESAIKLDVFGSIRKMIFPTDDV